MHLPSSKNSLITWLLLAALAIVVCSLVWPAAHVGQEIIPVGNDSFYHARRILDTAQDPSAFYEFDSKIHAPDGSLLVWPWGYDYLMGWVVHIGVKLGISSQPAAILVWIPVAAVAVSIGLILALARRMSLSLWSSVLAALCVALSPLTQYLHGTGFVDHHFAEYIFVLAMLVAGLRWFSDLAATRAAAVLGMVLGMASAIHNALFILQIPILITLFVLWLQGVAPPQRAAGSFAGALIGATVAILIPSVPFREGMFEFYLLSWFHLYVASGTALCCCIFSRWSKSWTSIMALGGIGLLLLLPLGYQMNVAGSFLSGRVTRLEIIGEMQSLRQLIPLYGAMDVSSRYSLLIWLVPLTWTYCLYQAWRCRKSGTFHFWICSILGLSLLVTQFRLHYFGSFALAIPLLIAIERFVSYRPPHKRKQIMLGVSLLTLLIYAPALRYQLLGPLAYANDPYFLTLRPVFATLAERCDKQPGTVLADHDIGHYIRYYTKCSVIANNFLLTPQHERKIHEMEHYFDTPAAELPERAPFIRYVLLRPAIISPTTSGTTFMSFSHGENHLVSDLLMKPMATPPVAPPPRFRLLHQARLKDGDTEIVYARLYEIVDSAPAARLAPTVLPASQSGGNI